VSWPLQRRMMRTGYEPVSLTLLVGKETTGATLATLLQQMKVDTMTSLSAWPLLP
jgi:hypothetical protein